MKLAVIGCGVAGISALNKARMLDKDLEIVALDQRQKSEWQALYPEVLSGKVKAEETAFSIPEFASRRGIEFIDERVIELKLREKIALTTRRQIEFDSVILAAGAVANYYGIAGAENCFSVNSLEDTLRTKQVLAGIGSGDSIAVIGAGSTGVEITGELLEIFKGRVNISLIELLTSVLPGMDTGLGSSVSKYLTAMGAKIYTSTKVKEIQQGKILTDKGEIAAKIVIWCAGIKPSSLAETLDVEKSHGWIIVDPFLRIKGFDDAYAIGDVAWVEIDGKVAARSGFEAEMQGFAAAANAVRGNGGEKPVKYKVRSTADNPSMLISLGNDKAVASLGDVFFSINFSSPSGLLYRMKRRFDMGYVKSFSK